MCDEKQNSANAAEPKFKGKIDHLKMMPVISASGQVLKSLFVLLGVEEK